MGYHCCCSGLALRVALVILEKIRGYLRQATAYHKDLIDNGFRPCILDFDAPESP